MNLILTKQMQECVQSATKNNKISVECRNEADRIIKHDFLEAQEHPISFDLLKFTCKIENKHIHEIMKGSGIYIEPKPIKPKNPEFEAYLEKLRAQQKEKEYNEMIASAITSKDQKFNLGIQPNEIKEIKSHIVTIFNIGFSMAAVFAAAYKTAQTMVNDYGLQILIGLGGAFAIGTVEGLLYAKYAFSATTSTKKKRKGQHRIATL
ncbi:endoplasmic reticulum-based factor for assembly of V-ATPase-domain-containing protein [Sporodiniella umbellata]|nr:endoplasmic reticulum-based factor for assembly of V-ATPase-domain-containing protein [Sporodiniella umbellata]